MSMVRPTGCWLVSAASAFLLREHLLTVAYLEEHPSSCTSAQGQLELKLVQVVFRHGARTPLTDRYWEGATWQAGPDCGQQYEAVRIAIRDLKGGPQPPPSHDAVQAVTKLPGGCTKGELTKPGQQQAFDLGAWLRQRYVEQLAFLPPQYAEDVVVGRSTNYRRTIGTLQGVLTGLYPGTAQTVPVSTSDDLDEVLFGRSDSCARLAGLMKAQARALRESAAADARVQALEGRVRAAMRLPEGERVHFADLHDALTSMRFHGKALPQAVDEGLLWDINREATRRMTALVAPQASDVHGPELLRLSMGPLFAQVVERMAASAAGQGTARLYAYSGHDTTLMPILATLGIKLDDWPAYTSNVVFELWEGPAAQGSGSRHYVRVLYNKQELSLAHHPTGEPIPLEEFEDVYLRPYLLSDEQFQNECKVTFDHTAPAADAPVAIGGSPSAVQGL